MVFFVFLIRHFSTLTLNQFRLSVNQNSISLTYKVKPCRNFNEFHFHLYNNESSAEFDRFRGFAAVNGFYIEILHSVAVFCLLDMPAQFDQPFGRQHPFKDHLTLHDSTDFDKAVAVVVKMHFVTLGQYSHEISVTRIKSSDNIVLRDIVAAVFGADADALYTLFHGLKPDIIKPDIISPAAGAADCLKGLHAGERCLLRKVQPLVHQLFDFGKRNFPRLDIGNLPLGSDVVHIDNFTQISALRLEHTGQAGFTGAVYTADDREGLNG